MRDYRYSFVGIGLYYALIEGNGYAREWYVPSISFGRYHWHAADYDCILEGAECIAFAVRRRR